MLQAGVARRDITPPVGLYLVGYGNRVVPNVGAREPLTVTAITLRDGATTVTLVACDVLAVTDAVYQLVQQQIDHPVLLCCSHTHSGPVTHAGNHSPTRYSVYMHWLVRQIVRAIQNASASLRPVTVDQGTSKTNIAVNRRQCNPDGTMTIGVNPNGVVDRSVNVLHVKTQAGESLAVLVNIACHPTVLDPGNSQASADWVGIMRELVERETHAPVVFVQGACGDLNPRLNHQPANRWHIRFQIGYEAAERVLAALANAQAITATPLAHQSQYIALPLENEPLSPIGRIPKPLLTPVLDWLFPWQATAQGSMVPLRTDVVRLGDVWLYALGAEVFNEIGMAVRQSGDLFAGVTNGCIGYLPTAAEHTLGGYEVVTAPHFFRLPARLRPEAEQITINALRNSAV